MQGSGLRCRERPLQMFVKVHARLSSIIIGREIRFESRVDTRERNHQETIRPTGAEIITVG